MGIKSVKERKRKEKVDGAVSLLNLKTISQFWAVMALFSQIERDPFNQDSDRSDWEKRTTSKGGPVFSKLFRLDRTDPLSFGPKFPEILVEWIAPIVTGKWLHQPQTVFFQPNFQEQMFKVLFTRILFQGD